MTQMKNTQTGALADIFPALAQLNAKIKAKDGNLILSDEQVQELITTGVSVGHAVNSIISNCNTPVNSPNAVTVYGPVDMKYLDGSTVSGGYASSGNDLKILEIFEGMVLVLIPIGSGAQEDGQWVIGYFDPSSLFYSIYPFPTYGAGGQVGEVDWNDGLGNVELVNVDGVSGNTTVLNPYTDLSGATVLYETPDGEYSCLLYTTGGSNFHTGYIRKSLGNFRRYLYLPYQPERIDA